MQVFQPDSVRWLGFDSLAQEKLTHALFTRHGGVSPVPWAELNMGGTVGDAPENVLENKHRALRSIGKSTDQVFDVWQVHSADVVRADAPRKAGTAHQKADAIITDQPGVTLIMRFADCVPILLYDPIQRAIGLVHAGWQGTVKKVVQSAIHAMRMEYRTNPHELLACIGPSICARHYQVGSDVVESVRASFGGDAEFLMYEIERKTHLDLWKANYLLMEREGVEQIEVAEICTACQLGDWYSHRGEKGKTGRFGVLLALEE